jgi:hypothetical protein
MNEEIDKSSARLRAAICAAEYVEAQRALLELSRAVSAAAEKMSPADGEAAAAVREALETLVWAERMVRAGREQDRRALDRAAAGRQYEGGRGQRAAAFEVEG